MSKAEEILAALGGSGERRGPRAVHHAAAGRADGPGQGRRGRRCKASGAFGVVRSGAVVQVVVGPEADTLACRDRRPALSVERTLTVIAPIAGSVVEMADVPDDVFAQEMLGPGVALEPDSTGVVDVVAPVDGVLSALHPHAFVIQVPDGRAVLVHLGLDTVRLLGETFTLDCCQGDWSAPVRWWYVGRRRGGRARQARAVPRGGAAGSTRWPCTRRPTPAPRRSAGHPVHLGQLSAAPRAVGCGRVKCPRGEGAGEHGQRRVLALVAPFAGTVMALADLPDPVYARGVVGPGLALVPDPTRTSVDVTSPCDGLVRAAAPHAVMLVADHGREVLVHLGVQVVDPVVTESGVVGQRVVVGRPCWSGTPRRPGVRVPSVASPLVALQAARALVLAVVEPGERVERGQPLLFWS